jgi:hypothetical protein
MKIEIEAAYSAASKTNILILGGKGCDIALPYCSIYLQEGEIPIQPPEYMTGPVSFKRYRTLCQRARANKHGVWRVDTQVISSEYLNTLKIWLDSSFKELSNSNSLSEIINIRLHQIVQSYVKYLSSVEFEILLHTEEDPRTIQELKFLARNLSWKIVGGYVVKEELDHMMLYWEDTPVRHLPKLKFPVVVYTGNCVCQIVDRHEGKSISFCEKEGGSVILTEINTVRGLKDIVKKRVFQLNSGKCILLRKEEI